MGAFRPTTSTILCALAFAVTACGERPAARKGDVTAADVIAGAAQSFDHFDSPEGKFTIDFPSVWKGAYVAAAHADTAFGSRFTEEFRFKPDAAWKVEPRTLMVVRIFSAENWAKASARPGAAIGNKLVVHGNDVFVLSVAGGNPYRPHTPAAELFDQMMLSVVQPSDHVALRLTPR